MVDAVTLQCVCERLKRLCVTHSISETVEHRCQTNVAHHAIFCGPQELKKSDYPIIDKTMH